jgi:hypothetical protein
VRDFKAIYVKTKKIVIVSSQHEPQFSFDDESFALSWNTQHFVGVGDTQKA